MQTQENAEATIKTPPTVEDQSTELTRVAEMRHRSNSMLVRAYVADFLHDLAFKPGLNGNKKAAMIIAFTDMMEAVIDAGIEVTKPNMSTKGATGKRVLDIGSILVNSMDNRMLLLARRLEKEEAVGSNVEANKAAELAKTQTETQGE